MTNLSDFLKVKQVRCVKAYGDCLTVGKEYSVLNIRMEVEVRDDEGGRYYWESDHFEPVVDDMPKSAEKPLQDMKLTPEFEAVEPVLADNRQVNIQDVGTDILDTNADIKDTPKFKVGDPVYFPRLSNKLCVIGAGQEDDYVDEVNGSKALAEMQSDLEFVYDQKTKSWLWDEKDCAPQLLYATPENCALLSQLYPHIEFEQPPKPLTGSDLARAMLDKGWKYVPCYVSEDSDVDAIDHCYTDIIVYQDKSGTRYFRNENNGQGWDYAVPFDPRTGEPLTQAVLDE